MAGKELEEFSLPSANERTCAPFENVKLIITAFAKIVIRIGSNSLAIGKSVQEIMGERSTEEISSHSICTAINHPDVSTNDMQVKMAMRIISWVTKRSAVTIWSRCMPLLRGYGRMLTSLIASIALNYIIANLVKCIDTRGPNSVIDLIVNKVLAGIYVSSWVNDGKYNINSTISCDDMMSWVEAGRTSGITNGVPIADINEVSEMIESEVRKLTDTHIKISGFMLMMQRIAGKYKQMAVSHSSQPVFMQIIGMLTTREEESYVAASFASFDPSVCLESFER